MSLIDTGWTLSVGEGVSAGPRFGITNVNWMSSSTWATSSALTWNSAESSGTKPGRVALMIYRPGGTSGKVTSPAPSVVVFARTVGSDDVRSSTWTPARCTVPSSVVIVATTRPSRRVARPGRLSTVSQARRRGGGTPKRVER